ncbi:MAG: division/cell wall cluster transcriptional repressor MraZ [Eggerthellaceae bacterium]|nr:division/cell wall cluster transcriptional repressor MraZ [Eggerthellaceae bacterium]
MEEARKTVDLNGSFSFKTDAKGRVSLPAKFRKVLSDDLVVTSALSGDYLMVFDGQESFNAWVDEIFAGRFDGGYNPSVLQHQKLRSALKGNAFDVQPDSAGRILLPANLREKAAIDREVVIVGNTGFFEVWSEARRNEMLDEVDVSSLLM